MEESILKTIKKLLGGSDPSMDYFDVDIITHINTVFSILKQLGVGPKEGFKIEDDNEVWSDFLDDNTNLEDVKTYIYLKVRMIFDPPATNVAEAFNKTISELEWRLNVEVDPDE